MPGNRNEKANDLRLQAAFRKWLLGWTSIVEIEQHYVLASALSEESLVLDLGANVGGFASKSIAHFGCAVLAVEPEQANFEKIPNHPKLRKLRGAIGGTCGQFGVQISLDPTGHRLNALTGAEADLATEQVIEMHDFPSLMALTGTQRIDLMKIDVEGCEWDWLDTITDQQLLAIGQLTIEFHDFLPEYRETNRTWPNYQRLIGLGFHCIEDPMFCSYNVLFVNPHVRARNFMDRMLIRFLGRLLRIGWKVSRLRRIFFRKE